MAHCATQAAWKFGDFHNVGAPLWTFQPELVLSREPSNIWGANWNFTAYTYWEIPIENSVTHYQSAPLFHADFTATGTWGKWTIGPVADYVVQVGHDTSSQFYANTVVNGTCAGPIGFECVGTSDFWRWYVGGLLQYNFGPVTLQFWATGIVASHASGSSLVTTPVLHDPSVDQTGYTLWFQASYALWTPPEAPAPAKAPLIYK